MAPVFSPSPSHDAGALETAAAAVNPAEADDAPPAALPRPQPADDVDRLLLEHLRARHADGSLAREIKLWGLDHASVVSELLLLATTPARDTQVNPVLSRSLRPLVR
jgi:hypothetical protein